MCISYERNEEEEEREREREKLKERRKRRDKVGGWTASGVDSFAKVCAYRVYRKQTRKDRSGRALIKHSGRDDRRGGYISAGPANKLRSTQTDHYHGQTRSCHVALISSKLQ